MLRETCTLAPLPMSPLSERAAPHALSGEFVDVSARAAPGDRAIAHGKQLEA